MTDALKAAKMALFEAWVRHGYPSAPPLPRDSSGRHDAATVHGRWIALSAAYEATAREALRLRGLVDAHNAAQVASCTHRREQGIYHCHCANREPWEDGELCDACPRRDMIDAAAPG